MEALLVHAERMNSGYIPMDTVTFMDEVLGFYDSHGTTEERIRANYMKGSVMRDKGDSPMALAFYLKAVSLADTTDQSCNYGLLSRIYGQIAELFHKQRYPQKELEMWNNAIGMARKADDTLMTVQYMGRVADNYWLAGDKEKAMIMFKETYHAYKEIGEDSLAASELPTAISYNLETNALEEARRDINEYLSKSGLGRKDGNVCEGKESFYSYLGEYYRKSKNTDSALYYYRKLITYDKDIMNLENGYRGLMEIYSDMHLSDSVVKYAILYANANDTANIRNSADEISRVQSLYDYSSYQQEALSNSKEATRLWRILFFCMIIAVITVFSISFFYRRYKARMFAEMSELNRKYMETLMNYNEAVAEYNKANTDKSVRENRLECQIEDLKKALASYQDGFNVDKMTLEQNLQNHQIIVIMHSYASKATLPTVAEWTALMNIVKKFLPDFFASLAGKHVDLTTDEQRLCILTRIGFIPSEIAVLMNMTKQRVSNMRSHLNKRLFNGTGAKTFTYNISDM